MHELFLTLCALTSLSCNDVHFSYHQLDFDTHAIAAIDIRGEYHIIVDPSMRKRKQLFQRKLLVHELAHIIVYTIDPNNDTHNEIFDDVCEMLSKSANVRPNDTCAMHSATPSHLVKVKHYRRD